MSKKKVRATVRQVRTVEVEIEVDDPDDCDEEVLHAAGEASDVTWEDEENEVVSADELCAECDETLLDCGCDRCDDCSELVSRCECERCHECGELPDDCECELDDEDEPAVAVGERLEEPTL